MHKKIQQQLLQVPKIPIEMALDKAVHVRPIAPTAVYNRQINHEKSTNEAKDE